jgi:hypothetical protein
MCAHVFTNGSFTTVHALDSKAKVAQVLTKFVDDVGIPDSLLSDGAPKMIGQRTKFMKDVNRFKIRLRRSEVGRSNQNYAAEREIGELEELPPRLWDYGLIYDIRRCDLFSFF